MPDMTHGRAVQVSARVRRIVAPNPGPMTAEGTNTYLLGQEEVAVVDPGPREPSHIEAILQAAGDKIRWILVTHTHPDHSPAAQPLAQATGAELMGNVIPDDGYQDTTFKSTHEFRHEEQFRTSEFSVLALHTPGHVANHFCFLVEEDGLLLTGDHLMNGSTVVIIPPHGDMADYIASLRVIRAQPIMCLGPGHGDIMTEPLAVIDWIIAHRLEREEKVLRALSSTGGGTLEALLPVAYDDVNPGLFSMAKMSLWAHLLKLQKEGHALEKDSRWQLPEVPSGDAA